MKISLDSSFSKRNFILLFIQRHHGGHHRHPGAGRSIPQSRSSGEESYGQMRSARPHSGIPAQARSGGSRSTQSSSRVPDSRRHYPSSSGGNGRPGPRLPGHHGYDDETGWTQNFHGTPIRQSHYI